MLKLRGISKVYVSGGMKREALKNVNVAFRRNEFAAILGPSGSGKTTLLNIIGGLDQYTKGDLIINGRSTKQYRDKDWDAYRNHRVGFVFQSYNLIPHQTVLQNVRLALTLSGISKRESERRAKQALNEVGLGKEIDKKPAQLSGGQMQRVAIARALVNNPDIVLADEPTGALDSVTSVQIMDILKKVADKRLVIMVTHNPELAEKYATRIITLKDGEITSDSNPCDEREEAQEESFGTRQRRTKMSVLTAFALSLKNLLTKKTRTLLIAVAGSIGIIGIALISAVSTGFQNYIDTIEQETLTSYPLTLMQESTDMTSILLSITGETDGSGKPQTVRENQELTGALATVSHNDLKSFMDYMDEHQDELKGDLRLTEKEYNVDPLIYTVDASGKLAKLNPSNLFSSLIGDTSLLSSYSSLTSVFQQKELENLQEESELVTGRWPENYNELVISLRDPSSIPDLMTYSLGFHDTEKLNEILTKILSGEGTTASEEPLELTYDELMAADLRLIPATATYRYNAEYGVYEDMSGDTEYMRNLYNNDSEPLKIVGIVTPSSSMSGSSNGVYYLPSLVTHIIDEAGETEIVKKQLAEPGVDVFSGKKFGEDSNDFDFEFSDFVTVDNEALKNAFGITIDQNEVAARTQEYMGEVMTDIDVGTGEIPAVREAIEGRVRELAPGLEQKFDAEFRAEFEAKISRLAELMQDPAVLTDPAKQQEIERLQGEIEAEMPEFVTNFLMNEVGQYVGEQNFGSLAETYGMPEEGFRQIFAGLMQLYMKDYAEWYMGQAFPAESDTGGSELGGATGGLTGGTTGEGTGSAAGGGAMQPGLGELGGTSGSLGDFGNLGSATLPALPHLPTDTTYPEAKMLEFFADSNVDSAINTFSVTVGQIYLKKNILTKIGSLTQYLTSSFANSFHMDQSALAGAFHLNFTNDELERLITTLFSRDEVTLSTNLAKLGYQNLDEPTRIAFYFDSFDGKTNFTAFLDNYNEKMREAGEDSKVIEYSDTTGVLMSSVKVIVDAVSYVLIAFVSISLVVSSIMIGVITYISVYERKKEIGILRAMGASKHNISTIFNAETFIIGLLAGLFGVGISYLLVPLINLVLHHFTGDIPLNAALAPGTAVGLVALSVVLTIIGGLIPAHSASKKDPVEALRSE